MLVHAAFQCVFHDALGTVHQALVLAHIHEAAAHEVRPGQHLAGLAVHRSHDDHQAVLGQVLAVPQDHVAHVAHAQAVHHDGTGGDRLAQLHLVLAEDNVGTILRDQDVAGGDAQTGRREGVLLELLVLAVHRQEIFGLGQSEHQFLLLLAGVAGNVHVVHALVDDLRTQQQQTVHDLGHALFVAGDGVGGDDDEVAGAHTHLTVAAGGHAAQCAQGFALAAGGDQHHLLRRVLVQLVHTDQRPLRDVHIAQLLCHGGIVDHAAAAEGHLAAILHSQINDLLHAVDIGRKGRNDDALVAGAGKQTAHTGGHLLLGGGKARALRVGRVAQQGQHTALAILGQGGQVGHTAGQRGVVDLEVAGLDDGAGGAVDGKGHGIRDGVVHMDGLHGEAAQLDLLPGDDLHELGLAGQAELLQLIPDQAAGQAGAVDGQVELLQQIRDAADVIAEANVESHGMGYGEATLAKNPSFKQAHLERNQRNVQRGFNHPSIIFWSLGNEAGDGPNFEACYKWIKAEDPSRACQYEQAGLKEHTDIFCPMYYGYEGMEKYGQRTDATKPLIQCEYAHAMGNSQGGFKEYWDIIRKYPNLQGGFIWDFVDQSVRWKGKNGVEIYAYGGDFNRFDASDNNFCDNGLISPDRNPNPHMHEVSYFYQNIWTTPADLSKGEVNVYNENFFRDLSAYYMEWEVLKGGKAIRSGRVDNLNVAPQQTAKIKLDLGKTCQCTEWLLNVSYKLKNREGLLAAGHTVAKDQLTLNPYKAPAMELKNVETTNVAIVTPQIIDNQRNYLIVKGENFTVEFNKANGYLSKYDVNGLEMIKEGAALTPNFWRAPTDNDMGAGLQHRFAVWKNPGLKLVRLASTTVDNQVQVTAEYDMKAVSAKLYLEYVINNQGAVKITQKMTADKNAKVSPMFRFGMQMQMPKNFNTIEFYGRGPVENYSDRNHSTDLGIYRQSVDEQFYSYIRPQETGNKTDIRWWKQLNAGGNGVKIVAEAPFSASALHYTIESLDDGAQKDQRHSPEVKKANLTNLCIDKAQMGLGCVNSWGTIALPKYQLPYGDYEFTFILSPVKHSVDME